MFNEKLLIEVNEWVQEQDKIFDGKWQQGVWSCGTGHCFGGEAVLRFYKDREPVLNGKTAYFNKCSFPMMPTFEAARQALGITTLEAEKLFDGDNDAGQIADIVAWIRNRHSAQRAAWIAGSKDTADDEPDESDW